VTESHAAIAFARNLRGYAELTGLAAAIAEAGRAKRRTPYKVFNSQ